MNTNSSIKDIKPSITYNHQELEGSGQNLYEPGEHQPRKHKILRSYKIDPDLAYSFKMFCISKDMDCSSVVELAMSNYMMSFPNSKNVNYTIVVQASEPKQKEPSLELCEVANCKRKVEGSGLHVQTSKEYRLCGFHSKEFSSQPKAWKVLP
jgi:hypothetical protein